MSATVTRTEADKRMIFLQRKLAAEQAQQAQAAAQQPEGSGASAAQRGQLPGFNPAASLQNGQVCKSRRSIVTSIHLGGTSNAMCHPVFTLTDMPEAMFVVLGEDSFDEFSM